MLLLFFENTRVGLFVCIDIADHAQQRPLLSSVTRSVDIFRKMEPLV